MKKNGLVIDGGSGTVKRDAIRDCAENRIELLRVDIRNSFRAQAELILSSEAFVNSIQGKKSMGEFEVVSGGIIGKIGDVIVDSISKPREIIGIADGEGGLLKNTKKFKRNLSSVAKKFKISVDKNT